MSSPLTTVSQDRQIKKPLDLEDQKKKHKVPVGSTFPKDPPPVQLISNVMTSNQKAALDHAHANSVGFFITQDSAFGNLILPVLPR